MNINQATPPPAVLGYYAAALHGSKIAQLWVEREGGKALGQWPTGVTYKSQRAAEEDLATLNSKRVPPTSVLPAVEAHDPLGRITVPGGVEPRLTKVAR